MNAARTVLAALVILACDASVAQDLVPAGTINAAGGRPGAVLIVQADPAIKTFAEAVRQRLYPNARVLTDAEAAKADLKGSDLVVYGTPENAWLAAHAARMPFRFSGSSVEIEGRKLAGEHLRLICALKNPQDPERRVVVYAARNASDVVGINGLFHGPTEWLVADGSRPLGSGSFAGAPLTVEQQRSDLERLRAVVSDVHAGTATGLPAEVADALARAQSAIDRPRLRADFWPLVQPALIALHDAHSSFAPPVTGERLALPLAWLSDGLIIREDRGDLRRGDKLLSLGGRDEAALLSAMKRVIPAENPYWLKAQGESLLADMGVLRLLEISASAPVRVRIERAGASLDLDVPLAASHERTPRAEAWARFVLFKEHDLALFTLDRCVVDKTYLETLEKLFTAVHANGIGRIAVDLRRNAGGDSKVVDEFLRYVDVGDYVSFGGEVRASQAAREQRGDGAASGGLTAPTRRKNDRRASPPPFRGELLVLVGNQTFSSGNWFAVVVEDNKLGKVIGEPTGNAPSSFGDILTFTLPESSLSFTLSHKKWLRPDPGRDPAAALEPDVLVPRTRKDVMEDRDPVLESFHRQPKGR